jgi:ribonucleoside-triphosphate reductase
LNDYQQFIALSRYSRWLEEENRRETWEEVVFRYINFMQKRFDLDENSLLGGDWGNLWNAIYNLDVLPSMRALMTAGPALERDHVAGYNCSYLPVDSVRAFDEAMYILMCGTGVGFSVERQYISQLPVVNEHFERTNTVVRVADSKAGWARALREILAMLYVGQVPQWDTSAVRAAGERLKTFGGRASGPAPLESLFQFVVELFRGAAGRRLTSLECHDIMCKIGEVVVVGGVRRSAMISLSNLSDDRMRNAKSGNWWDSNVHRALANNSACYTERPDTSVFMAEWKSLYDSHSGERGIFNREASIAQAAKNGRRDTSYEFGTNPCSEIILRPYQFCNLSEVVVRSDDTFESLSEKVRLATILGTLQSTLTDFKYLRKVWRQNTEEERLLGVSLTGILDNAWLRNDPEAQERLRQVAVDTNKVLAGALGIPQSTAITCVKPSGTVSQLVDSASGIHPRWAPYYIRTVRGDAKDPMTRFLQDMGVPNEPDVTKPNDTVVFSFPQRAPDGALCRSALSAIEHLEIWKTFQEHWCEHKPSITINVKEQEWIDVSAWVWKNFDIISGVSFLPYSEHTYRQAPYQEITEEEYNVWTSRMPVAIDWSKLSSYETEDTTSGSQELACTGGVCEIVDINR